MPDLKNPKHEAFVQEYVKDGNGARCYRVVYGDVKGAAQSAKNVLELSTVQERLIEVRTDLAVKHGLSQDQIVEDLQSIFEMGKANPERGGLAAAHQAKAQQAKILGYASEKKGQPVEALTDVELVTQIREGTRNDRLANLWEVTLKYSMGEDITADLDKIEADLRQAAALSHSNGKDKQPATAPTEA